jgi:hypothetical protein
MELLLIFALIFIVRLLCRTASPPRQIQIDVYHHIHMIPGPSERARPNGEVVLFRPRIVK